MREIEDIFDIARERGKAEGKAEERLSFGRQIIKNMRTLGKSDLEIAEVLGWDVKEINRVAAM